MKPTLTTATVALIAMAVAVAVLLILASAGTDDVPPNGSSPLAASAPSNANTAIPQTPSELVGSERVTLPEHLPASLEGTREPSGWAKTDANGSLIPTPQLRELFEYYLAALGEETLGQLVARIQRALDTLPEPARSEAMSTLGRYLDYKLALGELEASAPDSASLSPEAMARQFAEIRALRRQWLDADTAVAFFATEEAIDQFQLAQRQIRANGDLSEKEQARRLREAEQALPAPIRQAREQTRKFSEYQQVQQELANDPQALQAWRQQAFGREAAERLAQVEAEQQEWDRRWQAYQQAKAELARLGLAGPEQEAALQRLREAYFEGPERLRAQALDSLQ